MINALDRELVQYFTKLSDLQKQSLLAMMKSFLNQDDEFIRDHTSKEQYNIEFNEAMGRIDRGEFTMLDELEKEMESW